MSVRLVLVLLLLLALTASCSSILVNSINGQNSVVNGSSMGIKSNRSQGGNVIGSSNISNPIITNST